MVYAPITLLIAFLLDLVVAIDKGERDADMDICEASVGQTQQHGMIAVCLDGLRPFGPPKPAVTNQLSGLTAMWSIPG
jgi:hypothetical protein